MILPRVDLPAPFSPRSAWVSPGITESETPFNACTPGNALLQSQTVSRGGAPLPSGLVPAAVISRLRLQVLRLHRVDQPHHRIVERRRDAGAFAGLDDGAVDD